MPLSVGYSQSPKERKWQTKQKEEGRKGVSVLFFQSTSFLTTLLHEEQNDVK